jgi:hypothetical protein
VPRKRACSRGASSGREVGRVGRPLLRHRFASSIARLASTPLRTSRRTSGLRRAAPGSPAAVGAQTAGIGGQVFGTDPEACLRGAGAQRRRVVSRSFGRRIAGARVLRARSPCAATPRHGSGRRSAPSGADGGSRRRRTRSAPSSPRPPSVRPRCQAAYSSQECVFRNAFCSRARGCTSCQRERSTYWRASISRVACLIASWFTV